MSIDTILDRTLEDSWSIPVETEHNWALEDCRSIAVNATLHGPVQSPKSILIQMKHGRAKGECRSTSIVEEIHRAFKCRWPMSVD